MWGERGPRGVHSPQARLSGAHGVSGVGFPNPTKGFVGPMRGPFPPAPPQPCGVRGDALCQHLPPQNQTPNRLFLPSFCLLFLSCAAQDTGQRPPPALSVPPTPSQTKGSRTTHFPTKELVPSLQMPEVGRGAQHLLLAPRGSHAAMTPLPSTLVMGGEVSWLLSWGRGASTAFVHAPTLTDSLLPFSPQLTSAGRAGRVSEGLFLLEPSDHRRVLVSPFPGPHAPPVTVMKTWVCDSGQKLEIFIPFLGKYRPLTGRCCQTCTPRSWDGFYHAQLSSLGFRSAAQVTEEDTRYRGWLVRRLCCFLAVWEWKVPADTPRDLPERVCRSRRVRDVAAGQARGSGGDSESRRRWKEKALEILAGIQAPLSLPMLRLCSWVLLRLLSRLFLSVQLHRGQLEMVLRAATTPDVPLVFLSTHKSRLDGLLLSFLFFSQGLGVPRVTVGSLNCSPRLRALLRCLGGVFLPTSVEQTSSGQDGGLPAAVLASYVEEVLRSRQPLLIFLEEPCAPRRLSAAAHEWLAPVYRAVRDGAVPDVLLVPVAIAYDLAPDSLQGSGAHSARPLSLSACLGAACRALRRRLGCARVDFAQPFSLQEFVAKTLRRQSGAEKPPEELLLPTILGTHSSQLHSERAEPEGPAPGTAPGSEAEDKMMVTTLGLHALSDSAACSAVTAVGITSALLLHKHRQGVLLSRLMSDFAWVLEETLVRQRDVGFSGQLRALVWHSLALLRAHVTLYHLAPPGDILVVPEVSVEARWELSHHSSALLPVFAGEAVGACAIRALLLEVLPFLGAAACPTSITLSQDELLRKTLVLLQLLPPTLLGLPPCQPLDHQSQDVLDKLILCGLLEAEESENERWLCDLAPRPFSKGQPWAEVDFTDSDSDSEDVCKRCFKLREPEGSPGLLLFLCRLLSPVLETYARVAAFLEQPSWPQPEAACAGALQQFLAEQDGLERPTQSLALSTLRTFKEMGVLEEAPSPGGALLHLAQPFRSSEGRGKLRAFIQQFVQP
ncbi:glycerol-3-phosphate acyltransferase 2, mitochondrial isoform X4 [Oxyura jamaicensis]|uniref:glycerol-3-phosphate acyltransferase 2, mitochondrial isoform X4 n=1 Tax=Oxyura jamaicensis TaxID=8884 RepID=UPI0015A5E0A4|nr:glycerol-3-phosphate acyltransferase 2, mitochondrial isoform X4 [Oxyura jamaicensis]